jgi:hypothetical protein
MTYSEHVRQYLQTPATSTIDIDNTRHLVVFVFATGMPAAAGAAADDELDDELAWPVLA